MDMAVRYENMINAEPWQLEAAFDEVLHPEDTVWRSDRALKAAQRMVMHLCFEMEQRGIMPDLHLANDMVAEYRKISGQNV